MQSVKEAVSEKTTFIQNDIASRLNLIKLNVTSFAFENIKSEIMAMTVADANPMHKSHVKEGEKCLCSLRKNFRLPCRHILSQYDSELSIPLNAIHQRWRIFYAKGSGKYFYNLICNINTPSYLFS